MAGILRLRCASAQNYKRGKAPAAPVILSAAKNLSQSRTREGAVAVRRVGLQWGGRFFASAALRLRMTVEEGFGSE